MNDYEGATLMIDALHGVKALLADRGYNADWIRAALTARGIAARIPSKGNRTVPIRATHCSTATVTRSRTCSEGSMTGV